MSDFDEFLDLQKQRSKNKKNWLQRKPEWLDQINTLYKTVRKLLIPHAAHIKTDLEQITIYEEYTGGYEVPSLLIKLESDILRFKPIGTYLFGSPGRVDLVGPMDTVRFVLVQPHDTKPTIRILSSNDADILKPLPKISTFVWKISSNPPSIYYSELNTDNLQKAIVKATHG